MSGIRAKSSDFAKSYNFEHVLVSPKQPQANGEAEAAVKTVKSLWRKNENKNKALLDYRATPIPEIGFSPSQLCMGRRLRTTLPMASGLLKPETYNGQEIKRSFQKAKDKQKYYHDRHGTRELPPIKPGDHVIVKPEQGSKEWKAATVLQSHASPRSYLVDTGSRRIRRNRVALRADRPESHAGYQRRNAITLQQPEPEQISDIPDTGTAPQSSSGEVSGDDQEPTITEGNTRKDPAAVPERSEGRGSAPYVTQSGRQVRKPVKLNL